MVFDKNKIYSNKTIPAARIESRSSASSTETPVIKFSGSSKPPPAAPLCAETRRWAGRRLAGRAGRLVRSGWRHMGFPGFCSTTAAAGQHGRRLWSTDLNMKCDRLQKQLRRPKSYCVYFLRVRFCRFILLQRRPPRLQKQRGRVKHIQRLFPKFPTIDIDTIKINREI